MDSLDEGDGCTTEENMAANVLHCKIHNFGIYKKNGKRAILQIDFPGESIYLIQRGHIKKTYTFEQLQHFDSEEGLHIVLKFRDGEMEFDADNNEEKYTMCRLISLVLDKDEDEDGPKETGKRVSVLPAVPLQADKVIKEGVLEKKGNTTITTWNKRRLKVTPGEFSYYKPGDELALNIVQIWEDICVLKRSGQHGFSVAVRNRVYSFRLLHDQRSNNPEVEREEWIEAFHKAMRSKRTTYLMLENSSPLDTPKSNQGSFEFPSSSSELDISTLDDQKRIRKKSVDVVEENNNDEVTKRNKEVTKHFSVHLSYVEKTTPLENLPTAKRPKPPSFGKHDGGRNNLKPVVEDKQPESETSRENDIASVREKWNELDQKSSNSSKNSPPRKSSRTAEYVNSHKQKESTTMEVKIDFTEPEPDYPEENGGHHGVSYDVDPSLYLLPKTEGSSNKETDPDKEPVIVTSINASSSVLVTKTTSNSSDSSKNGGPKSPKSPSGNITDDEKYAERPLPTPPPTTTPPSVPAPSMPPPPPLKSTKSGVKLKVVPKMKLKQVHWTKIMQPSVSGSMWKNARDVTSHIDLKALEDFFSLHEKEYANIQPQASLHKKTKQALLDAKRAQNLSIMFNGPKPDTVEKLRLALCSITEDEQFPVEKLNTLRRYQPTADDIEMYRMYRSTRQDQHPVDRFMIELCDVPALDLRLDLVITILDLPNEFAELSEEVGELMTACEELTNNTQLTTVLEYLLAIGNYMNAKWTSGLGAHGFQITSVDKVLDVKSRDPQYTLVHFLVKQISKSNPSLLEWTSGVKHVQRCADLSVKAVGAEVEVLKNGLQKIKRNLKALRQTLSSPTKQEKKFLSDVQNFITEYERKYEKLNSKCTDLNKRFHAILTNFGESPTRTSDVLFSSVALFAEKFQAAREKR